MEIFATLSNIDNQSIVLIAFSVLLSFLLSSLIVFTYEKASRDVATPDHFLQSLILMSLVTTTIMQSIGDSPARGFGIFGALAILRFGTQLFSPRNISFIFAAMAAGIACGVYSFINAVIGTNIGFALKKKNGGYKEIVAVHNNEPDVKNVGKELMKAAIKNRGCYLVSVHRVAGTAFLRPFRQPTKNNFLNFSI
jgi:hypothetical protein